MRHAINLATVDRVPADTPCAAVAAGYLDHIRKVNDIFYDQLKASDQKAAYVFTIMLAFLAAAPTDRLLSARVGHSVVSGIETGMAILFVVASGLSFATAILAVLPRHVANSTSLFWGDWSRHRDILEEAARADQPGYLFSEYIVNAEVLAMIARRKSRLLGIAFRALFIASICYAALRVGI